MTFQTVQIGCFLRCLHTSEYFCIMPSYKLTYFPVRGRAEPIRTCFAAAGVEFEDVRIAFEEWPAFKPRTPFGLLPILEVDGRILAQSGAILRFVAKECELAPKDSFQMAQCESLTEGVQDLLVKMAEFYFCKDEQKKEELKKTLFGTFLPAQFGIYEKLLSSNNGGNGYFVGEKLTFADIAFFTFVNNALAQGKLEVPEPIKPFPKLVAHYNRVMNIPNIKKWLETRPVTDR